MSQRVSRVVIAGEPGRVTVDGEIVRHLVNVGPPGPAGPPGAGARIAGVVDTVGDLPVAADPGSIWIVRPDMMHVWDEVDGWQAVGPVSIVMPNINGLPTRPGGPQPTDEFWLASAGGAADFKSTIAALTGAVLGNISVVENSNGIAVRFPESRLQVAFLTRELVEASLAAGVAASLTWEFPEPFSAHPSIHLQMYNPHGTSVFPRFVGYNGQGATAITIQVLDLRTSGAAQAAYVSGIAVGRY